MPWYVAALLVPSILVAYYYGQPHKFRKPRQVAGADPADVAHLGPALAGWLSTTRELIARVEVTSEHAAKMLHEEFDRDRTRKRSLQRQRQDAEFLAELRRSRQLAKRWFEESVALVRVERQMLADLAIDAEPVAALLELPWGMSHEHDFARDRTDEIEANAASLTQALSRLHQIARSMAAGARPGYR